MTSCTYVFWPIISTTTATTTFGRVGPIVLLAAATLTPPSLGGQRAQRGPRRAAAARLKVGCDIRGLRLVDAAHDVPRVLIDGMRVDEHVHVVCEAVAHHVRRKVPVGVVVLAVRPTGE